MLALAALVLAPARGHAVAAVVQGDSLVGQVFNSVTNKGLPGYQVQLTAPKSTGVPVRIAITDADGRYRFLHVWKGSCLLEVYSGLTLVSRQVIDTSAPRRYLVTLRPTSRMALARMQPPAAPAYKPAVTPQ